MHTCPNVDVSLCSSLHASLAHVGTCFVFTCFFVFYIYNVYFLRSIPNVQFSPFNQNQPAVGAWETPASIFFIISSRGSYGSVLPILTVLGAVKGDVYDGHQTLTGVQSAEQPVWVGLAQNLQDVTFVEAQLPWFSGDVMTQSSHFT